MKTVKDYLRGRKVSTLFSFEFNKG